MAKDEQSTSGVVPGMVQEFIAQLRAATGRLEDLAGFGGRLPSAPGALPLPGALSAAQMTSIADSIAAAAAQHRGAESPAVLVRRAACGDGADPRPARGMEQDVVRS